MTIDPNNLVTLTYPPLYTFLLSLSSTTVGPFIISKATLSRFNFKVSLTQIRQTAHCASPWRHTRSQCRNSTVPSVHRSSMAWWCSASSCPIYTQSPRLRRTRLVAPLAEVRVPDYQTLPCLRNRTKKKKKKSY